MTEARGDRSVSVIDPYRSTSRNAGGICGVEPEAESRLLRMLWIDEVLLAELCEEL